MLRINNYLIDECFGVVKPYYHLSIEKYVCVYIMYTWLMFSLPLWELYPFVFLVSVNGWYILFYRLVVLVYTFCLYALLWKLYDLVLIDVSLSNVGLYAFYMMYICYFKSLENNEECLLYRTFAHSSMLWSLLVRQSLRTWIWMFREYC